MLKAGVYTREVQAFMLRTVRTALGKVVEMLLAVEKLSPPEDQPFYQDVVAALLVQDARLEERTDEYPPPGDDGRPGPDAAPQQVQP